MIPDHHFLEKFSSEFSCKNPIWPLAVTGTKEASGIVFARANVLSAKAGETRGKRFSVMRNASGKKILTFCLTEKPISPEKWPSG
jgi:hypothetical protein